MSHDYNQIKAARNSNIGKFLRSPLHYQDAVKNGIPDTPAMRFGRFYHAFILEPDTWESEFFIFDESKRPNQGKTFRDKENNQWKMNFIADQLDQGREMIEATMLEKAKLMQEVILKHPEAAKLIKAKGETEKVYQWTYGDPITGKSVNMKCKVDKVIPGLDWVIDLKTCADASEDGFQRQSERYGYHRQAAFYLDGSGCNHFAFITQEKDAPYAVHIAYCDKEYIADGRWEYEFIMRGIIDCRERFGSEWGENKWPGYEYWKPSYKLTRPPWAKDREFFPNIGKPKQTESKNKTLFI